MHFMFKKKHKQNSAGRIIIPSGHPNPPEPHEVDVAMILAQHYQTEVEFLIPIDDYKRKTPDIKMLGVEWEIKSPQGKSKSTIGTQFRRGSMQAKNLVLDTRRTKLKYNIIEKQVIIEATQRTSLNKVIMIDKSKKVVEIKM